MKPFKLICFQGGGKGEKSIADNVKKVRVVDCNGDIQHYTDADPEVMNALKVCFQ